MSDESARQALAAWRNWANDPNPDKGWGLGSDAASSVAYWLERVLNEGHCPYHGVRFTSDLRTPTCPKCAENDHQSRIRLEKFTARVQQLEAAIHWARMELGDHSSGCECKLCQTLVPPTQRNP